MSFRSGESMGDLHGDGPRWHPQLPAVAHPDWWARDTTFPPVPALTRETKWKQSWNWRWDIQEIKMILFIINEKWHSPLPTRCAFLTVIHRTWHLSTFPVAVGTQYVFHGKFTKAFPYITHITYKLQIFGVCNGARMIIRMLSQHGWTVTYIALPKASAAFEGGDSTYCLQWVVTVVTIHGHPRMVSKSVMDPNLQQTENKELHFFRIWMERGWWLRNWSILRHFKPPAFKNINVVTITTLSSLSMVSDHWFPWYLFLWWLLTLLSCILKAK